MGIERCPAAAWAGDDADAILAKSCTTDYLARCKDFFYSIFQPLPTYLGDVIPIAGNGNATNG